jgi:hypothetical protein
MWSMKIQLRTALVVGVQAEGERVGVENIVTRSELIVPWLSILDISNSKLEKLEEKLTRR